MIAKKNRLSERQVKKVLRKWKPFFSRACVVNVLSNESDYNRYAIVLSWKSVSWAVCRNYFRRIFYNMVFSAFFAADWKGKDIVYVIKKQTKLDKNDQKSIAIFKKEIDFLKDK